MSDQDKPVWCAITLSDVESPIGPDPYYPKYIILTYLSEVELNNPIYSNLVIRLDNIMILPKSGIILHCSNYQITDYTAYDRTYVNAQIASLINEAVPAEKWLQIMMGVSSQAYKTISHEIEL